MKHTKGKWTVTKNGNLIYCNGIKVAVASYTSNSGMYGHIVSDEKESEANAERIVQCVNGWDELEKKNKKFREALQNMFNYLDSASSEKLTMAEIYIKNSIRDTLNQLR